MNALVLESRAADASQTTSPRKWLARLAHALDAIVGARAARSVPEWRMREVRREINRHLGLVRGGELRRQNERAENAAASGDAATLTLPESMICNFSR